MLLGRTTFEGLAGYWSPLSNPWADILNPMPKYVASRNELGELQWNGIPIEGDAIEGVRRLKETPTATSSCRAAVSWRGS